MAITKPYHRNCRKMVGAANSEFGNTAYVIDREYAIAPEHYTRAFLIIQKDLIDLFQYIEPADHNLPTYSFRIHQLFMITCIEIEANFKAILRENCFCPKRNDGKLRLEKDWKIYDYEKINRTHHLDAYKVKMPIWDGCDSQFSPFQSWEKKETPDWYKAYNSSKHDRKKNFPDASFRNLLNAISGLLVVLTSQFGKESFEPGGTLFALDNSDNFGLGDYFIVNYPDNWSEEEKYNFNWSKIKKLPNRFQKIDYNKI